MNKRFAFILTLLILVPLVLAACGGDDDDEGGATSESLTSAFEALLEGDPEPAKALSCEDDHGNIEETASAMSALADSGVDVGVSCEVDGDNATCDLEIAGETNSIDLTLEDGMICGGLDATGPGAE